MQPSNWRYLNGNLKCLGFAHKSIFWLRLKNCRTGSICLRIYNWEVESKFLANASSDGIDPWQNSKFTVTPEARGLGSDTGWNCNWCSVDMWACEALMHCEHFDWCTVSISTDALWTLTTMSPPPYSWTRCPVHCAVESYCWSFVLVVPQRGIAHTIWKLF